LIKQRFTRITKSLTFTGFEADDVIATAVKLFPERKIIIVTVDTDLMQLVNNNVVWCSAGGHYPVVRDVENSLVWLNAYLDKEPSFVRSKLNPNLTPQSIIDLKVLRGDSSDSLPPGTPREIIDLFNPPQQFKLWEQDGILKYFEDRIIQKDVTGYTQLEELYDLGYTLFKHTPIKLNA
jgi:5'-3' exonuclease